MAYHEARQEFKFVGRDAEINKVRDIWHSVQEGHGQVIFVEGEAEALTY